jgi:hypothetical protein
VFIHRLQKNQAKQRVLEKEVKLARTSFYKTTQGWSDIFNIAKGA